MSFRATLDNEIKLTDEFKQSVTAPAITSGNNANCFFQSFFHTLTSQPPKIIEEIKSKYPEAIKAFVNTFNKKLSFKPPLDFDAILDISRKLHPLEREYVFGPILRHTYNIMIEHKQLHGSPLIFHPDAIVMRDQAEQFANAFGAQYSDFITEKGFVSAAEGGMPTEVQIRVAETKFAIDDKIFYRDCNPNQKLKNGKTFELNIVYAGKHLNYTLGTIEQNRERRKKILTAETKLGGIIADRPAPGDYLSLVKDPLSFFEIRSELLYRFFPPAQEFNTDLLLPRLADEASRLSSTAFIARGMNMMPSAISIATEKPRIARECISSNINIPVDSRAALTSETDSAARLSP